MLADAVKDGDFLAEFQLVERVADQERELRELEESPYETGELSVYMRGDPMICGVGVDTAFIFKAMDAFQHLILRMVTVDASNLTEIREVPKLLLIGYNQSVSGFVLREWIPDKAPATSRMKAAMARVIDLLAIAGDPSPSRTDLLSLGESGVQPELEALVVSLSDSGASLEMVERTRRAALSISDLRRARARLVCVPSLSVAADFVAA
ncbi:hypothetical protein KPL74_20055 [Bacillus sp. NP157]|nr:hypothetical protein KPL74_20055 [Bacillus sp. NP157]